MHKFVSAYRALSAAYLLQAKAKVVLSQQMKGIRPSDVQALVLWVLADRTEGRNPTWAFVQVCLVTCLHPFHICRADCNNRIAVGLPS